MSDERDDAPPRVPPVVWIGAVGGAIGAGVAMISLPSGTGALPALFIGLASVMLLLALGALWQSVRTALGGGITFDPSADPLLPERQQLLEEKATLLRALKDIAYEREVGKISGDDFDRLNRAYRRRAKEVLRALDQDIEPYVERARRMVAKELDEEDAGPYRDARRGPKRRKSPAAKTPVKAAPTVDCPRCETPNDEDAIWCKSCGERVAPVECEACSTMNDPDASFCKKCAAPLGAEASEDDEDDEAAEEERA